jgi:hypothetical protein
MDTAQVTKLIRVLFDGSGLPDERVAAAEQLGSEDEQTAMDAVLQVATADGEDETVATAAGVALAEILLRRNQIYDAPLAMFSGPAYLGFDETVARYQRNQLGR